MADRLAAAPSPGRQARVLRFACSCASAAAVVDDPWAAIAKGGKLNDGTKELILNAIYRQPRTIAQLAQRLGLSQPAIHRHITELLASELIREVTPPGVERAWAVERYYRPNFPVVLAADRRALAPAIEAVADEVATTFRSRLGSLAGPLAQTSVAGDERTVEELLHYLYAAVSRRARELLERDGVLPPWPAHADGSAWVWWAEETEEGSAEDAGPAGGAEGDA